MNINTKIEHKTDCKCFTCEPKKYDVFKVSIDTFKAVELLGSNMSEGRAYICERNWDKTVDNEHFITKVEVGTQKDIQLTKDLK